MSGQKAHDFFRLVRSDEQVLIEYREQQLSAGIEGVLMLAAKYGFELTEAELRAGFKHDWAMRWFRHGRTLGSR